MKKLRALVLGATGATGLELVKLLLNDSNIIEVSVFVRRKFNIKHPKLIVHEIDFSRLYNYSQLIRGDILFSALGTTIKDAGSKKKQYLVDYTYQYEFAKIASKNKVAHYSLVSSVGADKKSWFFYPRIKGSLEEAIKCLHFHKIQIFQPPSLIRQAHSIRYREKISLYVLKLFNSIGIFKSFTPLLVKDLAMKMVVEIKNNSSDKVTVYKPEDLLRF